MPDVLSHTTPEIYNPQTGRLDSRQIAEFLHLRTSDIASITGFSDRYVRKDPDAPSFQPALHKVATIIDGLGELTGNDKRQMLIWLNAPHPVLDNQSPLDLMRNNKIDVIVDLVDDILTGAPA